MKTKNLRNTAGRTPLGGVRIDRCTLFGNPFVLGRDGNREEVISKFREYFYIRILRDEDFFYEVEALKGRDLYCWCAPEPCHGDVIIEFLKR